MNSPTVPVPVRQPDPLQRHAAAMAEIQQMADTLHQTQQELSASHGENDRLRNKVELLEHALDDSRNAERVYRRKLIRLASAMENIGLLTRQAETIMRDARELDEAATEADIERDIAELARQQQGGDSSDHPES